MIIIQIRKKNGRIDNFNSNKIRNAIISAWIQVGMPDFNKIDEIVSTVQEEVKDKEYENNYTSVEEVENIVMSVLFKEAPDVAREYSSYKMDRERAKKNPTEIEKVLYVNDEVGSENANKNAELTHIKNAYLAEIPSKEMMRKLLPKDCVEAYDKSIVYFHDAAYSVRSMENCRLLNLDELLQNGCEINGVWIDKAHNLLRPYKDIVTKSYKAQVRNVDFKTAAEQARKAINEWVLKATYKKIDNLFGQGSITSSTNLVLANAVY